MKTRLLITITVLLCSVCDVVAQSIVRYYPDNWKCKNVGLDLSRVTSSPNVGEEAYVPPYYYAKYSTESKQGSAVVTYIEGHYISNPWSGWMVKSPKDRRKVVPTNIIPDLNGGRPGAFTNCTKLKKIVLPPTINAIGYRAFENCNLNELICMAVTPPKLDGDAFNLATIGKIVVPTGTLSSYKNTEGWNKFTLEEGAENYSECQMVECNGAWYEVKNGEAALVNSDNLTNVFMPETVTCLIKGQWKEVPVTGILPWSVSYDMVFNSHITDIPENWRDYKSTPVFSVTDNHPTLRQLAPNVISNKNGKIAHYIFDEATVPHGVTSIANNALNYCTTAYLPTTLTYIGSQSKGATLYFTSSQPPSSAMSSYGGYAPKEYLEKYNSSGYGRFYDSGVPSGFEVVKKGSDVTYWNPQSGNAILKQYSVREDDVNTDGTITLPSQFYFNEAVNGAIDKYDLVLSKSNNVDNLNKIKVPEGVKQCTNIRPYYNNEYQTEFNIKEIYLPSTLENCNFLSNLSGLTIIDINPANPKLDSRDNCNAVIETATNTLLTGCSTTTIPSTVEHISENAFKGLSYAGNTISIPASVKTIGKHAFENLWGSSPIQIEFAPESALTCIEDSVFYSAHISTVNIPNKVESIGTGSFGGCGNLKEVALGNSLKEIGMSAFNGCYNLADVSFGSSLKEIGDYAFRGCALTSLTLPDALERIGEEAFYGIPTLESITFGKSLKEIGTNAFGSCGITTLTLPDGLEKINSFAFSNCTGMTSINIGNGVSSIGNYSFQGCTGLTAVTIPNNVTSIGDYAFAGCTGMTSINIGNGVSSIGNYSFQGCTGLTSLTIPNNVTSIGDRAFINCIGMTSINIGNGVSSIGYGALQGCTGLTSVTVGTNVTNIGYKMFSDCNNLTSITYHCPDISSWFTVPTLKNIVIGNEVKSISEYAFQDCSEIKSITIPKNVTSIGTKAFDGCSSLASITFHCTEIDGFLSISELWSLKKVVIGDEVKSIGYKTFFNCPNLSSITFGNGLTSIGDYAFHNTAWYNNQTDGLIYTGKVAYCYKGTMPDNSSITIKDGTLGIAGSAFEYCSGLTSVTIPNSVTNIGRTAFKGCSNIASFEIPNSVTSIGSGAFHGTAWYNNQPDGLVYAGKVAYSYKGNMRSKMSISIEDGTLGIAVGAFYQYNNLASVTVPNSVTNIGSAAFENCSGLTSVTIGKSVKDIGSDAFRDCNSLTDIYCLAEDIPSLGENALYNANIDNATLHVPATSLSAYQETEPWSQFARIVPLTDEEMTGIEKVNADNHSKAKDSVIYSIDGRRLNHKQRGLNIIRMSDGTTRKVMVK